MNLLIMRHGEAEFGMQNDFNRHLTKTGCHEATTTAARLVAKGKIPIGIYASPLVRAQQTANLVNKQMTRIEEIVTLASLNPTGSLSQLEHDLSATHHKTLLLVSHQPLVGILIEYLTGVSINMGTGYVAAISSKKWLPDMGRLEWVIKP